MSAEVLPVLYQDEALVAVNKPANLLVHRSLVSRHDVRFAVQIVRDQVGRTVHPPHRLDRGTSGVLLFALDRDGARALGEQFEARGVGKTYLAVVRGVPEPEGFIDRPLARVVDPIEGDLPPGPPQPALTRWRRVATGEMPWAIAPYPTSRYSLVELTPETGRQHQLRRHLKHLGNPIVGDGTYGKGIHNRAFAEHLGSHRMLLHCSRLTFAHPVSGAAMAVVAPLPEDFAGILRAFGWAWEA